MKKFESKNEKKSIERKLHHKDHYEDVVRFLVEKNVKPTEMIPFFNFCLLSMLIAQCPKELALRINEQLLSLNKKIIEEGYEDE